jgi:pimeloyl-ACP methyl ester carboxylesterase
MKATAIPRLDRTIELADGRTLAFSEWGVPDGKPLVFLHGVPGSRLMCPDLDATEAAGVRLITVDRPGYGRSDLQPDRTRLNWVEDYLQLIDHLELDTCPVVGMSGGGPYALACAYRSPDRVPAIGLGGSLALIDQAPGYRSSLSRDDQRDFALLHRDRGAGIEAFRAQATWYDGDGWQAVLVDGWGDADSRVLARADVLKAMTEWVREGARQGSEGFMWDLIAEAEADEFSVTDIGQEAHIWIGDADNLVPRLHADYLAAAIPRARLVTYPGEGHLFPFDHWAEILAVFA